MVYAQRIVPAEEAISYRNTFVLISKSKRDQERNFEKMAIDIEQDLIFVGCVGVRDIVRPEAKLLVKSL